MTYCAYRSATSNHIVMLMSCSKLSDCPEYKDYVKIEVDLSTLPVDIITLIKSYDQFSISSSGTITQVEPVLKERKIDTLAIDTGMAVGHANTANIFTRL